MVVYVSTTSVYGPLRSVPMQQDAYRYRPADPDFRGIRERMAIDYHSPLHCSKASADRYVQDYGRLYGVPTVTLRADTVAGPRQFADAHHGWLAHSVYSTLAGRAFSIPESGLEVRDVLHVADLIDAILTARAYLGVTAGKVYNVGGGMKRSLSVFELVSLVEQVCHRTAHVRYEPARGGARMLRVGDPSAFHVDTGWLVRHTAEQAIRDISAFWHANQGHMAHRGRLAAAPESAFRHAA